MSQLELNQFHDIDKEKAVLSPCLWADNQYIITICDILEPTDFYNKKYQEIYKALIHNLAKDIISDIITVGDVLDKNKVNDITPYDLIQISEAIPSAANIVHHAKEVKKLSISRQFIKMLNLHFDKIDDIEDIIMSHQKKLLDLLTDSKKPDIDLKEEIEKQAQVLQNKIDGKIIVGYPFASDSLTKLTGGIEKHFVYVYGAREKSGKTKWIVDNLVNLAEKKVHTLFFSLEMIEDQVTRWIWSRVSHIDSLKIKNPALLTDKEKNNLREGRKKIANELSEYIDLDTRPYIRIAEMKAKIMTWLSKTKTGVVFLDFLQRFNMEKANNESKAEAITRTTEMWSNIAKELPISLIYMSQLIKRHKGEMNDFGDLLGSGGIAQNANVIILSNNYDVIYEEKNKPDDRNITLLKVRQRDGESAAIRNRHNLAVGTFRDEDLF